jgi:hypothetical protein
MTFAPGRESRSVTFDDKVETRILAPKKTKPVKPSATATATATATGHPGKPKMSIEIVVSR